MKLPRAWPKSSDSSSESGRPAQLSVDHAGAAAGAALMDQPRHDFLADAGLAGDEDLGVRPGGAVDLGFERAHHFAAADKPRFLLSQHHRHYGNPFEDFDPGADLSPGIAILTAKRSSGSMISFVGA